MTCKDISRTCWRTKSNIPKDVISYHINVLHNFPLFARVVEGNAVDWNFEVNGHNYAMVLPYRWYLWAPFVKTISHPQSNKRSLSTQMQEGEEKDVDRAYR
jgi:hypothetical protein